MKNIFKILALLPLFAACDDLFEPALENNRDEDAMIEDPGYAQGFLANAYILLPYQTGSVSDVATDDAVTNDMSSSYMKMATGAWDSDFDPMSQWQGRYNAIQYVNLFLENVDKIVWANDERFGRMFKDRLKGEAYGLRALHMYHLLRAHGGKISDGTLMGIPLILESENADSDFNHSRESYAKCVDQIISDANEAIKLLPQEYKTFATNEIPQRYQEIGVTNASDYNRVCGETFRGLMNARIAASVKAQVALMAASPAFTESGVKWEDAANYAADVLNQIDGISGIDQEGGVWYVNADKVTNYGTGGSPAEIIWRGSTSNNNDIEKENFPPSLYGSGRVNPTQNLVEAFPMLNGYPVADAASGYDLSDPYANRDPRLSNYIIYNGSEQGPSNTQIITGIYGTTTDVINKESGLSTRTGYYMRKHTRKECNPNSNSNTTAIHYSARIRFTEIFLIYAEAANEAWGPMGSSTNNYSAYDVIKAIRQRAGIGLDNGDAYLESVKGDKDKMRDLIRNERRIELCFENFRFWDLRRWNSGINEAAKGIQISQNTDGSLTFNTLDKVEARSYKDYMIYGPIPYSETQKWSNLIQNKGW